VIRRLRDAIPGVAVSVQCFDQFILDDPESVSATLAEADVAFASSRERDLLKDYNIALPATLAVTNGGLGAAIVHGGRSIVVSAPVVEVVDPTGAGDVFAGALLAGLNQNEPLETAGVRACTAAAYSVTGFGAHGLFRLRGQL
jgi:sugar/nucleoside kinase (ribokinase family)